MLDIASRISFIKQTGLCELLGVLGDYLEIAIQDFRNLLHSHSLLFCYEH